MSKVFSSVLLLILCCAAGPVAAREELRFSWPAACTTGQSCWIVNYPDVDPQENVALDYRCESQTYDGHHGTDIALADMVDMEQGVDVLAAADGKILRLRDGEQDRIRAAKERQSLLEEDKGCGNGVFIDHGNGWQSIYCHMKNGSLLVKPGQVVKSGQKIGEIGLSGASEFPHLHFGVFHDGKVIDPFTGMEKSKGCGHDPSQGLWRDQKGEKDEIAVYAAGFSSAPPDFEALKIDTFAPPRMRHDVGALVFWIAWYGARQGDVLSMRIYRPDGSLLVEKNTVQKKNQARQFLFLGKKSPPGHFEQGVYKGEFQVKREIQDQDGIVRTLGKITERQVRLD